MTETQQIIALLKTIDARLARIERATSGESKPVYIGIPPVRTWLSNDTVVVPINGKIR